MYLNLIFRDKHREKHRQEVIKAYEETGVMRGKKKVQRKVIYLKLVPCVFNHNGHISLFQIPRIRCVMEFLRKIICVTN